MVIRKELFGNSEQFNFVTNRFERAGEVSDVWFYFGNLHKICNFSK